MVKKKALNCYHSNTFFCCFFFLLKTYTNRSWKINNISIPFCSYIPTNIITVQLSSFIKKKLQLIFSSTKRDNKRSTESCPVCYFNHIIQGSDDGMFLRAISAFCVFKGFYTLFDVCLSVCPDMTAVYIQFLNDFFSFRILVIFFD